MRRAALLAIVAVLLLSGPGCELFMGGGPCRPAPPPLRVESASPHHGALEQPTNVTVSLTFTYAMDEASLLAGFSVSDGAAPLAGTKTYNSAARTCTFAPATTFSRGMTYTVEVPAGTLSRDKGPLGSDYVGTFATHNGFRVHASSPWDQSTGVATNASASVLFNMPVDAATVTNATFVLAQTSGGPDVGGVITLTKDGCGARYDPGALKDASQYYWRLDASAIKSVDGTLLDPIVEQSFTTGTGLDQSGPSVKAVSPTGGHGVAPDSAIVFDFSEPIDPTTLNADTFVLYWVEVLGHCGIPVPAHGRWTFSNQNATATFKPAPELRQNIEYWSKLSSHGVGDPSGNPGAPDFYGLFYTGGTPTVLIAAPSGGKTAGPDPFDVAVLFSVAMDATTLVPANFTFDPPVSYTLTVGSWGLPNDRVDLVPTSPLPFGLYTITVSAAVLGMDGRQLDGNNDGVTGDPYVFSFTRVPHR